MADWRDRFRAPQISTATPARRDPDRWLVVASLDGSTTQLHAWDARSCAFGASTGDPLSVHEGWIDPPGEFIHHLRDDNGSEFGHLVRIPFGGGEPEDLTPGLAPYTLRGIGFDGDGSLVVINPVNADGFALYAIPSGGEPRLLHRDTWETWGALASARGDLAACWSTARAGGVRQYTLLVFDTVTGERVGELDDGPGTSVVGTVFSPVDGDDRIVGATTRTGLSRPVVWNPRTGGRTDLPLPELTADVVPLDWSPDAGRILLCQLGGVQRLHSYDVATGTVTALDHPPGTYHDPIEGGATYDPAGHIVGLRRTAVAPPSIVELSGTTGRQRRVVLTAGSAPPGRPWRSVTFASADGTTVQAWVATPAGAGPFPTILETHGGPHYTAYEKYDPGVQAFLDHGYAWISVNYRGSVGFGRDFTEKIWGDMGHWELADMAAAHGWLVREGIARADEIFAFGASYGGYLTLFALGRRPDLWAGGMGIVAEADLAESYTEVSEALQAAMRGWMKGSPEERPEAWARSSPITYVADVAAPVLVIQARNDSRIGVKQMEDYERRMREHGKEIELAWLDGGHQSFGPDTMVYCWEKLLSFVEGVLARRTKN
jgi:dipeptidyl aminopeptidase/acylaminoacyl peptidase